MSRFLRGLLPFFWLGIVVVVLAFGLLLLSYLLILGAIVGFILYVITFLKNRLFAPKQRIMRYQHKPQDYDHQP